MPRLRRAFGSALSSFGDIFTKLQAQQQIMERQRALQKLIAQRDREQSTMDANEQRDNLLLMEAIKGVQGGDDPAQFGPELARLLAPYGPSLEERMLPAVQKVASAKNLDELAGADVETDTMLDAARVPDEIGAPMPGGEDLPGHRRRDDISRLVAERRASMEASLPPELRKQISPVTGVAEEVRIPGATARQMNEQVTFPQERSPYQEIARTNEIEKGTRAGVVARAGAESGARAGAAASADIQTRFKFRGLLEQTEQAIAQGRATGRVDPKVDSNIMFLGDRMIELATKLNTAQSGPKAILQGAKGYLGAVSQQEWAADVRELRDMRHGLGSLFANKLGHKGVLTEKDLARTDSVTPDYGLTIENNRRRNKNFKRVLGNLSRVGDSLPPIDPSLPPEMQSQEYQRRLDLVFEGGDVEVSLEDFLRR